MDDLGHMDQDPPDDFTSDSFFDQNSLQQIQQIDDSADLAAVGSVVLPPNPGIIQHLSRRWYSGCLEKTAWSRHGHLATISEDGTTIYLECLRYSHRSRSWDLQERYAVPHLLDEAVSLAWSSTGGELAVVDLKGRIWVFHNSLVAVNRLVLARQGAADDGNELSQPVGMTWLNQDRQERPRNVVPHASKIDSRWQHANARAKPLGPYWHRAVAVVHRNGLFTLCFQRVDGQYSRVSKHLSPQDDVLYSHASFAPTVEGTMLIALHSFDSVVSICFLSIDWTAVKQTLEGLPVLTSTAISSKVFPQSAGSSNLPDMYDPDSWLLSHLEVIQTSDVEKTVQMPPTVLAISSGVNKAVNPSDPGYLVSSLIRRWTVNSVDQSLHPLFEALAAAGSGPAASKVTFTLQSQPDKTEQVITTVHHVDGVQALVVTTQENRTDFLSSEDLSPVSCAASVTETSSMAQSGFVYPYSPHTLSPSFSTNACVRADVAPDGRTHIAAMEYQLAQGQSQQTLDPNLDVAIAGLNLAFARACWSNASIDDVLMCAQQTIPPELIPTVISSMYRSLFRDVEFISEKTQGSDLERVFHKPVMGKVMAYHASLTANCPQLPTRVPATKNGSAGCWSLSAQWAWLANNIRQTATVLFMNLRDVQNLQVVVGQDFTDMMCSNLRWGLSLIRFIVSNVLEVGDRETNPDMFDAAGGERIGDTNGDGRQGLVALLLNCHTSRIFLIAFVRAVRAYAKITDPKTSHQVQVLHCIQQQTAAKGISFPAVEALLEYRWGAPGDVEGDIAATATCQLEMMSTGIVHESYQGTINVILTKLLNSPQGLRAKMLIDRLKLYTDQVDLEYLFLNQDILGRVDDEPRPKHTPETRIIYDIHRKRPITKPMSEPHGSGELMIRKCMRCGSYSEDINVPPKDWPRQVALLLARCICDGNWVMIPWSEVCSRLEDTGHFDQAGL